MLYNTGTAVEPISLAEVRSFLSIDRQDQTVDTFLQSAITMVRTHIEDMCPFYVSDREITLKCPNRHKIFVKGEVSRIMSVTTYHTDGMTEDTTEGCGLISTPNGSYIYPKFEDDTAVEIVFNVEGYMTDTIRLALLTAIRNLYLDRTTDPFTDEVMRILKPYIGENI